MNALTSLLTPASAGALPDATRTTAAAASREMPMSRILRAYVTETRFELLRMARAVAFIIPFLVIPVPVYLLFAVVIAGQDRHPGVGEFLFLGFSTMAVIGPAIFGTGCPLAVEREQGLLRLKRALPVPAGAYLLAKVLMQMVFAACAAGSVAVAAVLCGKLSVHLPQVLAMIGVLTVGTLPFCAIGLFIGTRCSGAAAPGYSHLLYLPMLYLSGVFFPLPQGLAAWAVIWPTFHLEQVAYAAAGLTQFRHFPPGMSLGFLAGVTVLFGGLALRRLARTG